MIRVNLLPGGRKRRARRGGLPFKLPSLGGAGALSDPWKLATFLVPVLAVAGMAWMWWSVTSEREELDVAIEEAVQDSARYADIRAQTQLLRARSDSVIQKVSIIQEIDEGRYVWPHIMDEVARALPEYTWLTAVAQLTGGTAPQFQITGNAGNPYALTRFMTQLEASPFLRSVRLISMTQVQETQSGQVVQDFELQADYAQPPLEFLETVPLFGGGPPEEMPVADTTEAASGTD